MNGRAGGDPGGQAREARAGRVPGRGEGGPTLRRSGVSSRLFASPGTRIVAEIKARSPSAGEILRGADGKLESFALHYRRGRAAAISVVTEEDYFGGKPEWVPRAKSLSGLPVLMKDFVISERQLDFAVSLGADAVLLIVRALTADELAALSRGAAERGLAVVVEAHDAEEIRRAAAVHPDVLGVNARDLATFATDRRRARRAGERDSGGARAAGGKRDPVARGRRGFDCRRVRRFSGRGGAPPRRGSGRGAAEPARMTDVKICGLTRPEDVAAACELGAALLGFNFVASSPRRLTVARARQVARAAAPGVGRVGRSSRTERAAMRRAVAEVPLDYVQLHRPVTAEDDWSSGPCRSSPPCESRSGLEGVPPDAVLSLCGGLLWDSSSGKGLRPDWDRVPPPKSLPVPAVRRRRARRRDGGRVIRRPQPVRGGRGVRRGERARNQGSREAGAVLRGRPGGRCRAELRGEATSASTAGASRPRP